MPPTLSISPTLARCAVQEHPWERYRVHVSSLRSWSASRARGKRLWQVARKTTHLDDGPASSDSGEEHYLSDLGVGEPRDTGNKLVRTVSFADEGDTASNAGGGGGSSSSGDQAVRGEKLSQVSGEEWEQVAKKHMFIRICYDPLIGGSVMPMSGITGQATPRLLLWAVSGFVGVSIIMMGMVISRESSLWCFRKPNLT